MDPKVSGLREAAIAAWRQVDDFYQAHVGENGVLAAEHEPALEELNSAAKSADDAFAKAAAASGQAQTARERIDTYTQAVRGTSVDWTRVVGAEPAAAPAGIGSRLRSLGQKFIESKPYRDLLASGSLGSDRARIGQVSMFQAAAATDLLQTGDRGADAPLAPFLQPTYIPDPLPLETAPRTIASLFTQDTAPDGEIKDVRQTSRSGSAAAVGQATDYTTNTAVGGLKPQVSANWEIYSVYPSTIAAWAATTRQALSQPNRTRTLIDSELGLQVALEEEDQIVNGNGTNPNISGILDQDVQTLDAAIFYAADEDANLFAIRRAKTMVRTGLARVPADGLVVHPNDSERFDLLQDGMGRFRAGDPFNGASDDMSPIWRLPRVESEAIAEGTAIVGAFRLGGTVYRVQGLQIFVSDSHEDYFIRNLIAILGEERIAFLVRRPKAFVVVTLADWTTGS